MVLMLNVCGDVIDLRAAQATDVRVHAHPTIRPAQYTRCDLVAYDLVASYGIDSSSILYDTSYATYDHTIL